MEKQRIGLFSIKFLKTTIIGGLLFLLPIVLASIILGYALQLAGKVAQAIAKLLPNAVVGIGGITVPAALVLVLFSFLAGLEQLENGWVAIFIPQAPTPMSGKFMYLRADRVRPLAITMVQAMAVVKRMGVGSGDALRGSDLTLPAGA